MAIYRIYAVPLCPSGRYGRPADQPIIVKSFKTVSGRQRHWEKNVLPNTGIKSGADFEYVLCDLKGGSWQFVSEKRYARRQLLQGKREYL